MATEEEAVNTTFSVEEVEADAAPGGELFFSISISQLGFSTNQWLSFPALLVIILKKHCLIFKTLSP